MKNRSFLLGLGLLSVGLVGLAVWRVLPDSAKPGIGASENVDAVRHDGFVQGDVHRYDLSLSSQVTALGGTVIDYRLAGTWTVEVLEASKQRAVLRAHVEGATLSVSGQAAADAGAAGKVAQQQFASPLVYTLDAQGVLEQVSDNTAVDLQVRSLLRAVAAVTQHGAASSGKAAEYWSIGERDNAGAYVAAYRRLSKQSLEKRKLRYVSVSPQVADQGAQLEVEHSRGTLQLREDGLLLELELEETLRASGAGVGGVGTTSKYHLAHAGSGRLDAEALAAAQQDVPKATLAPDAYPRQDGYSSEADRARIAGRSFDDFVKELNGLPAEEKAYSDADRAQAKYAFIGLAALFRQQPDSVARAKALIAAGSPHANLLWDILGSAGTPEAQAALRDIIDMPQWNQEQRLSQMIDLSLVPGPTVETVSFMKGKWDDPEQHAQARYGVGTAAFNLRESEPERALQVVESLKGRMDAAQSEPERLEFLTALGNSGHPAALEMVTEQLQSSMVRTRTTALDALRFMESEKATTLIVQVMKTEADESVRRAAIASAGYRPASQELLSALGEVWRTDPSESVRRSVQESIQRLDARYPGLMTQMEARYAAR